MRYSTAALWLFAGSVLLPQGVGLPLPGGLPNLDLPRLAVVALVSLFLLRTFLTGQVNLGGAPRTMAMLALLAVWQVISAYSTGSTGSMIWAVGNAVSFWGFGIACISLMQPNVERDRVIRMLFWVIVILAVWSVFEMVTQQKVFPTRNLWTGGGRFSTTLRRVIPGAIVRLPLMSIGPYAVNLTLGGALCTLGGFLVLRPYQTGARKLLAYSLFFAAVLATQSRAALLAVTVMLILMIFFEQRMRHRVIMLSSLVAVAAALFLMAAPKIILLIRYMRWEAMAGAEVMGGSAGARLMGMGMLVEQVDKWWLFGTGPGSVGDTDRVSGGVQYMSDAGHLVGTYVETGLIGGSLLMFLLLFSIRDGVMSKDPYLRAAAVGLVGYFITAMISVTPWNLATALVVAGVAESWRKQERRAMAPAVQPAAPPPVYPPPLVAGTG